MLGHRVFYVDSAEGSRGESGDAPILLLHGFPTASVDFHRVWETLAAARRVIVHDHLGFGLSAKPRNYSYSLFEQADIALALWRQLGVVRGHVVAHDYGTSIATELAARAARANWLAGMPVDLASLTLSNGSVLIEMARLRPIQRLLRLPVVGGWVARCMTAGRAKRALRRLWFDPSRVDEEDLEAMWQAIRHDAGHLLTPAIIRYLEERARFRERWLGALRALEAPAHILWARQDPVAVPAIAERLAAEIPGARLTWIEDAGHFPMLEAADSWSRSVVDFVSRTEAGAGEEGGQ